MDPARNALIVGEGAELGRSWLAAGSVNWIDGEPPAGPFEAEVQIRYRATPAAAIVTPLADGDAEVQFAAALRDITPGQGAVFYRGERCLGGGPISRTRSGKESAV